MKFSKYSIFVALYVGYLVVAPVSLVLVSVRFFGDSSSDLGDIIFVAFGIIIFVVFAVLEYRWLKRNREKIVAGNTANFQS